MGSRKITGGVIAFLSLFNLSSKLRAVSQLGTRLKEAVKLGFKRCVVPRPTKKNAVAVPAGLELIGCRSLQEAIQVGLLFK